MSIVLDASFCLNIIVATEGAAFARPVPEMVVERIWVPTFFWHKVASGLRNMHLKGRIPCAMGLSGLSRGRRLGIQLDAAPPPIEEVLADSNKYQLTVYDAAYLELALRTRSRLATADGGLASAARRADVALVLDR